MTLYTKKKGKLTALTRDQVRKLRRTDKVITLQKVAWAAAVTLNAHANWLKRVQQQGNSMKVHDLKVANLPNQERMKLLSQQVFESVNELRKS